MSADVARDTAPSAYTTTTAVTDPSYDARYAAVAAAAYDRTKPYPSLRTARYDTGLSDTRNAVYVEPNGHIWWGIRGSYSSADIGVDGGILLEHAAGTTAITRVATSTRKAATESKYRAIRAAYPSAGLVHIAGHSLGGALAQHALMSMTKAEASRVRVHTFNSLQMAGFDARRYSGNYFETRHAYDPVSMWASGPNLRTISSPSDTATAPLSNHGLDQFVGKDLSGVTRGRTASGRGDDADRTQAIRKKAARKIPSGSD